MRPPTTNRPTGLLATALGGILSLVVGAGILALGSDTHTSEGNRAESSDFTASHQLSTAAISHQDSCSGATFEESGPMVAIAADHRDFDSDSYSALENGYPRSVCLRNDGSAPGRVVMSALVLEDVEMGVCDEDEAFVDSTCTDGGPGELSEVLHLAAYKNHISHTSDTHCDMGPAGNRRLPFATWATPSVIETSLAPGETCRLTVSTLGPQSFDERDKQLAQTDRVTYSVSFTLEDAP